VFAGSSAWQSLQGKGTAPTNVARFYNFLSAQPVFREVISLFPAAKPKASPEKKAPTESTVNYVLSLCMSSAV